MKEFAISSISFYQGYLSFILKTLLGTQRVCYQVPTCSEYTKQAIERYGFFSGSAKGLLRIVSCR